MKRLGRVEKCKFTERVLQFGEGNFLRGFVDWMIDRLNKEADTDIGVVVIQPLPTGTMDLINEQDGLYTLYLRGLMNGIPVEETRVVECITRCINPYENREDFLACAENPDLRFIVSNTTEAGIEYIKDKITFPARMTLFLYARYETGLDGFIFLPCELIDGNGDELKKCIIRYAEDWNYGEDFIKWLNESNHFTNTLVDRIVTGYPKDTAHKLECKYGYHDSVIDTAEIFHLWVIESDKDFSDELPFDKYGMNVIWTHDVKPYKKRKVRILNGAHTMMVPAAYLSGLETVGEAMSDEIIYKYLRSGIYDEIIPTLDLPENDLVNFAENVTERFKNPFIKHYLTSILLNSVSKFAVRVLPSILDYHQKFGKLPPKLMFSFAALIEYYKSCEPNDSDDVADFMKNSTLREILSNENYWNRDLTFMSDTIEIILRDIHEYGIKAVMENLE